MTEVDVHEFVLLPVEMFTKANHSFEEVGGPYMTCYLDHTPKAIITEPAGTLLISIVLKLFQTSKLKKLSSCRLWGNQFIIWSLVDHVAYTREKKKVMSSFSRIDHESKC